MDGKSQFPQTGQLYFTLFFHFSPPSWLFRHNPLKRVKFISITILYPCNRFRRSWVTIPSNGSSLFQCREEATQKLVEAGYVTIPSNGSSLFQSIVRYRSSASWKKSQSPQTGQVYFNRNILCIAIRHGIQSHNPLKRVKFISIYNKSSKPKLPQSHNPLKRVKFISIGAAKCQVSPVLPNVTIPSNGSSLFQLAFVYRCQDGSIVTIPSNGSSLFQC